MFWSSYNSEKIKKFYTNKHLSGDNFDYQKFIVLSYRRSGTNYFMDLLRSHQNIIAYSGLYGNNIGYVYTGYPSTQCKSVIKYRNKKPVEFLENYIFQTFDNTVKAVGFKITYDTRFPEVLNYLKKYNDLKVINLRRKNIFRMVLSNMIALKIKKWHVTDIENENFVDEIGAGAKVKIIDAGKEKSVLPDDFKIYVDYNVCLKAMQEIVMYAKKYENFFSENSLIVYYEDIVSELDAQMNKVLEYLGVEKIKLKSMLKKINDKKLYDVVENYNDLKKQFKGTEWYCYFDD